MPASQEGQATEGHPYRSIKTNLTNYSCRCAKPLLTNAATFARKDARFRQDTESIMKVQSASASRDLAIAVSRR